MAFIDNYSHVSPSVFYVKESILGEGVNPADFHTRFNRHCSVNCTCENECCNCISSSKKNYMNKLLILEKLQDSSIYECGSVCSCSFSTCPNRIVQKGPHLRLEVRYTPRKGYGLFAMETMSPGTFVCEYAGELISKAVASRRCLVPENAKYILALREHYGQNIIETHIDASMFSNIGRYANHSCSPNSTVIPTRTGFVIPRAAIFTIKLVKKNEEITYSYGEGVRREDWVGSICFCGSDRCVGYLPASLYFS